MTDSVEAAFKRLEKAKGDTLDLPPNATAHDVLQAIYRSPKSSPQMAMKAAAIAIEYERARLAVTALINGESFALALERTIDRSGKRADVDRIASRLIEAKPAE